MKSPVYNSEPTYICTPAEYVETDEIKPNWFSVYECRGHNYTLIFSMSNRGDRLHNLLARGIPVDQAKNLFYQMDS
jgi:hypothetical protein